MRPPQAKLAHHERFLVELFILRAYLLASGTQEAEWHTEWIRSCVGYDDEHFAPLIDDALDALNQLRRTRENPADFVADIEQKMEELRGDCSKLASA